MKRLFALIDDVWMLVLEEPNLTEEEAKKFGQSFNKNIFKRYPHAEHLCNRYFGGVEPPTIDYNTFVMKYGTIVIRPNGTWFNFNEKDAKLFQKNTVENLI